MKDCAGMSNGAAPHTTSRQLKVDQDAGNTQAQEQQSLLMHQSSKNIVNDQRRQISTALNQALGCQAAVLGHHRQHRMQSLPLWQP